MLFHSALLSTALASEQFVFGYYDHYSFGNGFELVQNMLPGSTEQLAEMSVHDVELLRMAWNKVFESNPDQVFSFLDPTSSQSSSSRPVKVSKKEGFTVHSHPSFPNYELRVKDPGPELGLDPVQQYTGYIDVLDEDKHFFFWLFESRSNPKKDPVMLWLNGGPGSSSAVGEFFELGPSLMSKNGSLYHNPYAWNEAATVIFLDQPVNVGYSYGSELVTDSKAAGEDVYSFLEILFDALPQYSGLPFHISGESYAGKYLPAIGAAILNHPERTFNLSSALIGNPITDPALQAGSDVAMVCGDGGYPNFLSDEKCYSMYEEIPVCERLTFLCYDTDDSYLACGAAQLFCATIGDDIELERNPYDISMNCTDMMECYPEIAHIVDYLRNPEVIKAVGSDVDMFNVTSPEVNSGFAQASDFWKNEGPDVLRMLEEGVKVLFYDGDYDLVCSWPGVYRLVSRLRYEHHAEFNAKPALLWEVDGKPAGEAKSAGNLSWMRIYGSGHMVPHDKGKEALAMVKQWLDKGEF